MLFQVGTKANASSGGVRIWHAAICEFCSLLCREGRGMRTSSFTTPILVISRTFPKLTSTTGRYLLCLRSRRSNFLRGCRVCRERRKDDSERFGTNTFGQVETVELDECSGRAFFRVLSGFPLVNPADCSSAFWLGVFGVLAPDRISR
jgi:hypothetical protein